MNTKLKSLSRVLLMLAAGLLVYSIFVPIWQIDLDAPQYPEGLNLKIFADKLGGDVDIINGLNHYIGMKTLHAKDFIEFSVLTYIILFYAVFAFVTALIGKRKVFYFLFSSFVLFGVIAMADFWRWEYNYGHDLDPHAAIIVPGMAYQPPLIGFKQLLNFGAYSIPDVGGWLFVVSGFLMLVVLVYELKIVNRLNREKTVALAGIIVLCSIVSCQQSGPEQINLNKDDCSYCKMSISDKRFACEVVTAKGRVYKFDDVACMVNYCEENNEKSEKAVFYISDYTEPNALTEINKLFFVKGENILSPMGGGTAAFSDKSIALANASQWEAAVISWKEIYGK